MLIKLPSFPVIKAKNNYNSRISLTSLGVLDARYPSFDRRSDCVMTYKCDLLRT